MRWLVAALLSVPCGGAFGQFDAACTGGKLPYFAISGFNQTSSVPAGTGAGASIQVGATSFWTYATPLALCQGVADGYVASSAGAHTPVINAASEYNCAVQRTNSNGTLSQTSTNVFKHCGTRELYDYPADVRAVAAGTYTGGGSSGGSSPSTITLDAAGAIAQWQAASALTDEKVADYLDLFWQLVLVGFLLWGMKRLLEIFTRDHETS